MKKILLLITIAMTAIAASASDKVSSVDRTWNYSFNHISMSQYYGSIVGGIFYDGPMSFTDIIAKREDLFGTTYVDVSIGQKLDHVRSFNKDGGNEYNLMLGRTLALDSGDIKLNFDYCLTYLAVHNLGHLKDDVVSNNIRIDVTNTLFVQPYLVIYRFDTVGKTPGSGWFVYGGVQRKFEIANVNDKPITLGLEYRAGYSGTLFGTERGLAYHRLSVSLTAEVGEWTITPTVIGQTRGNGQRPGHAFVNRARMFAQINMSRAL